MMRRVFQLELLVSTRRMCELVLPHSRTFPTTRTRKRNHAPTTQVRRLHRKFDLLGRESLPVCGANGVSLGAIDRLRVQRRLFYVIFVSFAVNVVSSDR